MKATEYILAVQEINEMQEAGMISFTDRINQFELLSYLVREGC